VRVPDDCICAHANQSRIRRFPLRDKENCLYSKDVISFAREKGYFKGKKDSDFSFADAYAPADFSALRFCEARVWSFFNRYVDGMEKYLPYASGENPQTAAGMESVGVRPESRHRLCGAGGAISAGYRGICENQAGVS
jgi:dipeptidase